MRAVGSRFLTPHGGGKDIRYCMPIRYTKLYATMIDMVARSLRAAPGSSEIIVSEDAGGKREEKKEKERKGEGE